MTSSNKISQKSFPLPQVLQRFLPDNRIQIWIWAGLVVLTGALALLLDFGGGSDQPSALGPESPESAATYIPAGYVLVPIEVANYESLDSILGKFGVVDLYSAPADPTIRPKKVATKIKILRAPLNPNHFAVLAKDSDSEKILGISGPFTVVVQNPRESGTGFVNEDSKQPANSERRSAHSGRTAVSRITIEVNHADESSN